ncbi:MAG: hypothetical protein FWG01_01480 [Betaproteobacteria bacterium]|nr:hypothetical protein [Betaproteobacteria bacterium]
MPHILIDSLSHAVRHGYVYGILASWRRKKHHFTHKTIILRTMSQKTDRRPAIKASSQNGMKKARMINMRAFDTPPA